MCGSHARFDIHPSKLRRSRGAFERADRAFKETIEKNCALLKKETPEQTEASKKEYGLDYAS